jgi:hypothetical protein
VSSARQTGEILAFTPRPRPLRAGVPPFDPNNDAHLRAWESLFALGQLEARRDVR